MKTKPTNLTQIRSTAIGRCNRLQKLHRHLDQLRPAFRAWLNGSIYIGGRGAYRFRTTRELTLWSDLARSIFPTVADFAFAAAILAGDEPAVTAAPVAAAKAPGRTNVIQLAQAA